MQDDNPYRSPTTSDFGWAPRIETQGAPPGGVWRDGNCLVMDKRAKLPNRCVKSNLPAEGWLRRDLSWHHPAVFLALLAHILIYIILALILRKRATIYIGLTHEWFARRRRAIIIGWGSVLLSIVMGIAGIALVEQHPPAVFLIVCVPFLFFGGAIYGLLCARMVTPKRITDQHVWLKGVHPEFLATLPPLP